MKNVSNKIDLLWYRINIQLSEKYCVGWERLISWILTLGENGWREWIYGEIMDWSKKDVEFVSFGY